MIMKCRSEERRPHAGVQYAIRREANTYTRKTDRLIVTPLANSELPEKQNRLQGVSEMRKHLSAKQKGYCLIAFGPPL